MVVLVNDSKIEDEPGTSEDKTGKWYAIYEETGQIDEDNSPEYHTHTYSPNETVNPLDIKKIANNMFSGTINNIPIAGALINDEICFEVIDSSKNIYCYVEGTFEKYCLELQVIYHSDQTFSKVVGASYIIHVQEDSKVWPSIPASFFLKGITFKDVVGTNYVIENHDHLTEGTFDVSMRIKSWGNYISFIETEYSGVKTLDICVFKEYNDGVAEFTTTGNYTIQEGVGVAHIGKLVLSNGKFDMFSNLRLKDHLIGILCAHLTGNTNYDYGGQIKSKDVSGKWVGELCELIGNQVNDVEMEIVKEFQTSDPVFASIEKIKVDGKEEMYFWIGYTVGNEVYILAEINGTYYPLIGYVEGDVMHLSGYMLYNGVYRGLNFELRHVA
jgi:hypothetical protein